MKKRKVQTVIFYKLQDKTKQFLLLQMNKRRKSFWQNATGGVEQNEKAQDAALREAIEETGLKRSNVKKLTNAGLSFKFDDQRHNHVTEEVFFLECYQEWKVQLDPSEHQDFKWVHEKDINQKSVHYQSNYRALVLAKEFSC